MISREDVHTIDLTKDQKTLAEIVQWIQTHDTQLIVQHEGEAVAAVIPIEDLRLLEQLIAAEEDRIDAEEAERILTDPEMEWIPWDQVKKERGL